MEAKQPATLRELLRQLDQQGIYDYRRYRAMRRFLGFRAREKNQPIVHHPEKIRKETQEMKIKEGFVLRNVVDEHIVMPTGDNIAKFEGAVVLNEVAAFVYKQLENPVGRDDLLAAMLAEYEIDEATAAADLDALLEQFQNMGLIEG